MNDIDFDELDKAVNSLSASAKPDPAPTPEPTAMVNPEPPTPPAPRPPVQSSGRFMDVVHPSSDMRSAPPIPPRPVTPSPTPAVQTPQVQAPAPVSNVPAADSPSPFLPDAKVEKRPLGGFNQDLDSSQPAEQPVSMPGVDKQEDLAKAQTPLPPELQDELLLVETSEDTSSRPAQAEPEKVNPNNDPMQPNSSGSIMQQYVEKSSATPNDTVSPVFGAESYSKPKKQKGKSGWMVVLWILLLVILGAGAGAAIYFYVLPLL